MSAAKVSATGLVVLLNAILLIAEASPLPNVLVEDFIEVPDLELELDELPALDYPPTPSSVNVTTGDFEATQNLDVIESDELAFEPKRGSLRGSVRSVDTRNENLQATQRILWGDEGSDGEEPDRMGGWMRGEIQLQVSDAGLTLLREDNAATALGVQGVLTGLFGSDTYVVIEEVEQGGRLLKALEDASDSLQGSTQHLKLIRQWVAKREKLIRMARVSNLTAEQSGQLEMLNVKMDSVSAKLQAWQEKSTSAVNRIISIPAQTLNSSESVRRLGWEEDVLDPNYCPWYEGNTCCDNLLECMDGTTCDGEKSGWGCCAEQGSRKKCPPNYPHMCNDMSCGGGTSHCCGAYNCDASGGPRECGGTTRAPPPKAPGDECIWSNDGMCDEPMWCEEGTDTTDCLNNPGGGFSWGYYGYGGYGG